MWSTILSLIPTIAGLFSSNKANDDYQANLDKIKADQRLSQSALQAKALLGENATRGLAGYDTMKEDILSTTPTTLNESRDFLSGSGVVDFLAKSKAMTDQQLRQLNAANEQQKQTNMNTYANYLGGVMANREDSLMQGNNLIELAKGQMDYNQAGTNNKLLGNITGTVGGIADLDWKKIIALLSKTQYPSNDILAPKTPTVATFDDTI